MWPVSSHLSRCRYSRPCSPPPADVPKTAVKTSRAPKPSSGDGGVTIGQHSGRLAAKPNCGLPSMEKARLVLLKKNGLATVDNGTPSVDALRRCKDLFKQPMTAQFIDVVTSLVQAGGTKLKKNKSPASAPAGPGVAVQA